MTEIDKINQKLDYLTQLIEDHILNKDCGKDQLKIMHHIFNSSTLKEVPFLKPFLEGLNKILEEPK